MHATNESFQFCICNPVAPSLLAIFSICWSDSYARGTLALTNSSNGGWRTTTSSAVKQWWIVRFWNSVPREESPGTRLWEISQILLSHQQEFNEVKDFPVEWPKGEARPNMRIFCSEVKYHQNSINWEGTAPDAARTMKSLLPDARESLQITHCTSCKNKMPLKLHSTQGSSYLHSLKKWPHDFQSLTAWKHLAHLSIKLNENNCKLQAHRQQTNRGTYIVKKRR